MAAGCCGGGCSSSKPPVDRTYRRILWIALIINAGMFLVELIAGAAAGSVSLQADAMDFLGDAANYLISLLVLGMALQWRARAALLKGLSLGAVGLWVAGQTAWNAVYQTVPQAEVMGIVGAMALAANVGCALMLYFHRDGDANRQLRVDLLPQRRHRQHRRARRRIGRVRHRHRLAGHRGRGHHGSPVRLRRHPDRPPVAGGAAPDPRHGGVRRSP